MGMAKGTERSIAPSDEYVALIDAGRCRTPLGFRKALVEAFFLPAAAAENLNDINWYIFSPWLGFARIRMIFTNSGGLRKCPYWVEIQAILALWKADWESKAKGNRLTIESR